MTARDYQVDVARTSSMLRPCQASKRSIPFTFDALKPIVSSFETGPKFSRAKDRFGRHAFASPSSRALRTESTRRTFAANMK